MEEQERIEGQDEDVEGHGVRYSNKLQANEEPSDEGEGDDVEGHVLHRPTNL